MKSWIGEIILVALAAAMAVHGPVAQLAHYHEFADTRTILGIPNAADVLSNVGFAGVGLWGLLALWPDRAGQTLAPERPGYVLFVVALVLTAIGSGYYHLAPDNGRLVWDRIPIALACAGLLAAVDGETARTSRSPWILIGLIVAAIGSVWWWSFTEGRGAGDLRPYLLMQAAPLVLIPIWQGTRGAPRDQRLSFGIAIALYVAAKGAELADRDLFAALGFMSGHTLKHLLSVAASALLVANAVANSPRSRSRRFAHVLLLSAGIRRAPAGAARTLDAP